MNPARLRIAVISTPRAGNTWVRHLLGTAYQVPHLARHSMSDEDWAALPPEVVLQIHWRRTPEFQAKLNEHGFRVVTVARHPLDVLISILHFCIYESESEHWLLGASGTEAEIYSAMPRSRAFIEYAKGPRAAELLAVTPDWWDQPGVVGLRYEDCVRDTDAELQRFEAALGPVRVASRAEVIEKCSLGQLRQGAINNHFWKGSPGLWKHLLAAAEATELASAITDVLACFGYASDPDPNLTPLEADRNWVQLVGDEVKLTLQRNTEGHRAQLKEKDDRIAELDRHCDELTRRLKESTVLSGPIGRAIKSLWNRSPRLANAIRTLTGRRRPK
jgi:hypothetical protein